MGVQMKAHDRIIRARGIAAALAARDPIYTPIFERLKDEAEASADAMIAAEKLIFGRRRQAKEQSA